MTHLELHHEVAYEIDSTADLIMPWFGLAHEVRNWLPASGGWSIEEVLHHITLTSHYLLILINKAKNKCLKAKARGEVLDWPGDYQLIPLALQEAGALDGFKWERHGHMDPRLFPATGDVKALFLEQMSRCHEILDELEGGWGLWSKTMMSVNDLGKLDVYQYLVFLCKHAQRHHAQMERNLAELYAPQ